MKSTIDPSTIRIVLLTGLVIFMATIAIPELLSKIPAAAATVVLTAYLGARAVCDLVFGWIPMVRDLDAATTFDEVRAAGQRYGRLVGTQTARILILLDSERFAAQIRRSRSAGNVSSTQRSDCLMARSTWGESMEFRRPTPDERRLLLELAKISGMRHPEAWVDTLKVREMNDGGMGSLSLSSEGTEGVGSLALVTCEAAVQFTDEDGVEVVASLNASENGTPLELDIWKTNFAPLRRIPTIFRRVEG